MEKTFDLKFVKVSELDKNDTKLLKKYLSILSVDDVIEFLLKVLDTEYFLGESNEKVEKFITDKQFNKFRGNIMREIDKL